MKFLLISLLLLAVCVSNASTGKAQSEKEQASERKYMSDTKEIDNIILTIYEVISGPAGQARDWDRLRELYLPEARMTRTVFAPDGSPEAKIMSVDQYIEDTNEFFSQNSFYEQQIALRIETFGCVAHAFSVYEARYNLDDPVAFKRGINSIQLFHDGQRWRVVSVLWDNEREDNPIPKEFLP